MITLLVAGFIVNVGAMMQPTAPSGSGPPPTYTAIATGSGAILATGNGTYIITH